MLLGTVEELAIDADVVASRVMAGAKGVNHFSVYLNTPFENDLLSLAAAGDAGLRENLLQAVAFGLVVQISFRGGGRLHHGVCLPTAELLIAVKYVESLLSLVSKATITALEIKRDAVVIGDLDDPWHVWLWSRRRDHARRL